MEIRFDVCLAIVVALDSVALLPAMDIRVDVRLAIVVASDSVLGKKVQLWSCIISSKIIYHFQ